MLRHTNLRQNFLYTKKLVWDLFIVYTNQYLQNRFLSFSLRMFTQQTFLL